MNEYIFKLEAKEYEAEGIGDGTVVFKDNKPTLDLIESVGKTGKNMGIIATLDNEINVSRGSNEGVLAEILKVRCEPRLPLHFVRILLTI